MESCDALIVGGGPAGSSCAWKLRRGGMDVMVMDKAAFPRDKVCAGWITPAVPHALQLDLDDYAQGRVLQRINAFRTGLMDRGAVETRYPWTVSYGIRRCEFDDYLLRRSGARLQLGQAVKSLRREGRGWIVNEAVFTPLVVGAGGHFCPVARHLGARLGAGETAVAAKEIEIKMSDAQRADCRARADMPELYFCRDLLGYGWCLRKGDYLNVGLGREDSHRLSEHLEDFCARLAQSGRIPKDLGGNFHGHAYLVCGSSTRKRAGDGILLVGDAAGLAYPQSGEGIRPAVESGLMAAEVILGTGGDYSPEKLMPYAAALAARFGKNAHRSGPSFLRQRLAGRLLGSRWFTRHVLLDRWFLRSHYPALRG